MNNIKQGFLPKNFSVNEKYTIIFFIKQSIYAESYRVKASDGKPYFLKLFNYSKLHRSAFDNDSNILENEFLKKINHPNITSYKDSGELICEGKKFGFLVLDFIAGETLAEQIARESISTYYDVKLIATGILNGLNYLHNLPEPIIHNEITLQNIMLDLSGEIPLPKVIDFGYARSFHQSSKSFNKEGLNLNYVASECFNNLYSPQSDLFSVGAVMYHLLFGLPPWHHDLSKYNAGRTKIEEVIIDVRKKPLAFPDIENNIVDFDESILKILKKALQPNPENRFKSANEFLQAINGEIDIPDSKSVELKLSGTSKEKESEKKISGNKKNNKGFSAIAGMQELKDRLMNDVIDLINDAEGAEKYNISMPNGMLLYGPPGCGKTFFAERFAEETGFNFKYINPSDLGSIYVHGTQGKIGDLFKEARENAPFIICLDEVSSIFPSRGSAGDHQIGEVDEFLTQLNNCGQDGVFVIALTNFPEIIDEAILRAGRLDIKIFVPPPDYDARKALFDMYLKEIPKDFGIDYEKLAMLTENYVSSDIKLLIDDVARSLRKSRGRVTMELLENKIDKIKPSVKIEVLNKHERIRKKFETNSEEASPIERTRIGFKH